jgi:hypothetical protein
MATPTSISEVLVLHNKYQDSMVATFETHLRQIVLRAQGKVLVQLQKKLTITDGVIDATPANMRSLRFLGPAFMDAMRAEGYEQLVDAFVGEFKGMLPFLNDTFHLLGEDIGAKWQSRGFKAKELNLLASSQLNATVSIDAAVESVAGTAMTRGLFGVAGLQFGTLAKVLTERFETSISKARSIADTSQAVWYATATDTAFQAIEESLPSQEIRYRYWGPQDKLERKFCQRLTDAKKAYTRDEIGRMNNGQIPNVMISRGGFNCRHQWILDTHELDAK